MIAEQHRQFRVVLGPEPGRELASGGVRVHEAVVPKDEHRHSEGINDGVEADRRSLRRTSQAVNLQSLIPNP